jgi:hypothetical protein
MKAHCTFCVASFIAVIFWTIVATSDEPNQLIVHEWGTFTTIAGEDGLALEWRPLVDKSDLPGFVHDHNAPGFRHPGSEKQDLSALVRMETPVIYFYSPRELNVSVRVDFPQGRITEWYPQARTAGNGIDWGLVRVVPGTPVALMKSDGPSHYYAARDVDAAAVRICSTGGDEWERFLFYRGVGNFQLPLRAGLESGGVRISDLGAVGSLIVFENRDGKIGYRTDQISEHETMLPRPLPGSDFAGLMSEFEKLLVSHGLYEKEARAMLATWRDSWFEEGLRIFYVLPRENVDAILPATIEPAPQQFVRVLVGRIELITPEMTAKVLEGGDGLKRLGRFAEPILRREIATSENSKLRERARMLLAERAAEN